MLITYHTLGNADIVGGRRRGGLIGTTGITENGQLLGTTDAAFAKTAQLDPIGTHGLIGGDDEVITFTWSTRNKEEL